MLCCQMCSINEENKIKGTAIDIQHYAQCMQNKQKKILKGNVKTSFMFTQTRLN